jgi:hypothetical protein
MALSDLFPGTKKNTGDPKDGDLKDKPLIVSVETFPYECVETCTFMGKYRKVGDIVFLPEKKDVPHFKYIDPPTEAGGN